MTGGPEGVHQINEIGVCADDAEEAFEDGREAGSRKREAGSGKNARRRLIGRRAPLVLCRPRLLSGSNTATATAGTQASVVARILNAGLNRQAARF